MQDRRDAERVAAMFNDFDTAWPGGFTRGNLETAETIQAHGKRMHNVAVCVVEHEGEFVGFCNLEAQAGQREISYIGLLGARLSHHGKGVGKMLLRDMVRRCTELGYRQVTLHTWPGNTKAVPLYKKTGFHWVPETDVFMRNFLPTALTIPAGKAFFAHRDWYDCLEREIVVAPDDVKWKGMRVYPYRFRDGDDFLNLIFDAASERLTALETPEYAVSCVIPVEEAPAGETVPITWEITPHGGRPLEVALLTEAEDGLEVSAQERLHVDKATTLTRELRIAPDAQPRREGQTAHRVRSTLLIDGQPLVLETGVKVVRPIEIEYHGQGIFPGREEKIVVTLKSHLDTPVTGRLALDAHPDIACAQTAHDFTLPPRLRTQCEFTLSVQNPGVFETQMRYEAEKFRGSRPVTFRAFGASPAVASIDAAFDESAVLESPEVRLITNLRGGWTWLHHNGAQRGLMGLGQPKLGPPFAGWQMKPALYAARIEQTAAGPELIVTFLSPEFPGLTMERAVSFLNGSVLRVVHRVVNTSDQPQSAQLRFGSPPWLHDYITLPLPIGLIHEPARDFPQGDTDALPHGAKFTESWAACEEEGLVCGFLWHPGPEEDMQWNRFPNLTFDLGELAPHSLRVLPPVYLVAGNGDWKSVRGWWRRLIQPSGVPEEAPPEPERVLLVRTEPSPALLMEAEKTVSLTVQNRRNKALSGTLTLTGETFAAAPTEFALQRLDRDHPFSVEVRVKGPETPAAGILKAALDSGPKTETFEVPLVRLGAGGDLRVSEGEQGAVSVENGLLTLRAAPEFLGSLFALEREGVNHLFSAYPEARPFQWTNPWFGGVHPSLGWDSKLTREKFSGGPVERVGERGRRWQGVRAVCQPEHKDLRWLQLEVEYLTLPGSNVVALVTRWTNRTDARTWTHGEGGITAWLQVGGTRENAVLHWESDGQRKHRRRGGFAEGGQAGNWAAVENAVTGDAVVLIASAPRAHVGYDDMAEHGPHLNASGPIQFEPNETKENLAWLVLTSGTAQIEAYAALAKVRRLP
jgi:ribosomal protein S18 acetylase RimI-like enzyme